MNYLFVNGFQKSFYEMAGLLGNQESLKLVTNHKEKLDSHETGNKESLNERGSTVEGQLGDTQRRISEYGMDDLRNQREGRRSETGIPRKMSLIRLKSALTKENEEVHKIGFFRSSDFKRIKEFG